LRHAFSYSLVVHEGLNVEALKGSYHMVRISTVAFATLLTAGMVGGFLGCEIDGSDDDSSAGHQAPSETSTEAPKESSSSSSGSSSSSSSGGGLAGFLWKPISEGDGNLVILLPSSLTGNVERLSVSGADGSEISSNIRRSCCNNGNREHFRFDDPGAAYGNDLTVTAHLKDGETISWSIPNGGSRVD